MDTFTPPLNSLASSPAASETRRNADVATWYEAFARAWGATLDGQAARILALSADIGPGGLDNPSTIIELTTESLRMGFLSNSQSTSVNSVGQALETMARKN